MPETISLYAIGVWFCVGFFVGIGWVFGTKLAASLLAKV